MTAILPPDCRNVFTIRALTSPGYGGHIRKGCGRIARLAALALSLWPVALHAQSTGDGSPAPPQPAAAPEPQYPRITIGTLTYLQYGAELKNRDAYNAFDVTRGYINVVGDLAKNVKFRLTPDLRRIADGTDGRLPAWRIG